MKLSIAKYRDWIRLILKLVILVVVLWLIFGVFVGLHRVNGVTMSNRVEDGDLVLYSRINDEYAADDVIIFEHDAKTMVSSILAMPNDLIEIDENGCLYVNGIQVSEDVVYNLEQGETPGISLPYRVPNGSYFLLNENLEAPEDSRSFGAIFKKDIKGKIVGILRTRSV